MKVKDLHPSEFHPYYQTYISKVGNIELKVGLSSNGKKIMSFLTAIPNEKHGFSYAEGKWTIKEVVLHLIDTERIFAYRALRLARQDKTPLPGFDQDAYVMPSKANARSFESLLSEYKIVRKHTIALFENFDNDMLLSEGTASDSPVTVRALGFIIMGHENHHCEIIKERYLNSL